MLARVLDPARPGLLAETAGASGGDILKQKKIWCAFILLLFPRYPGGVARRATGAAPPRRRRRRFAGILAAFLLAGQWAGAAELIGDPDRGERLFGQCRGCHRIGPGAVDRIGPHLNGIFGRRAGSNEGFPYSRSMRRMGADGLVWTLETLDAYIANPRALVSKTRMSYQGMPEEQDRADLLAYLRRFSDNPANIPEAAPTARGTDHALDPAILALEGDPEYGAYLATECLTCHRADGTSQGIPSITRWPTEDFVIAMHAYKNGLRPHPVMQMMAGRLSDEEIAALAAYFRDLDQ